MERRGSLGHKRLIRDWIKLLAYSKKQSSRRKKSIGSADEIPDDFDEPAEAAENTPDETVDCDEREL